MGVHGLTTYLRENERLLSTTLNLPSSSSDPIPIVIDGWSFIYDVYRNSNLPWVYGGEYPEFYDLVAVVVNAWIKVGLKIFFVFDGPTPQLKFSTVVSRLGQSHVQPSLLFFRTSPVSRGTARFLNENRIIPPLAYTACISALKNLRDSTDAVEVHFADEEGDPYAVELAGKLGAYVVGNDSDFVVLNTEGYLGYIPLEEMMWHVPISLEVTSHEEDDGGFQEVRKPKSKRRPVADKKFGRGIIPPDGDGLTLSFVVYKPDSLAAHLNIPVTLLPLLGALVGNDLSRQTDPDRRTVQSLFFDRQLSLSQRITRVASTIQTILSPSTQKRKILKHQVGSVMDLIDRAVNQLLTRLNTPLGTGEIDIIVEKIVEATLQYAIPKRDDADMLAHDLQSPQVCALHPPSACSLLPLLSRRVEAGASDDSEIESEGQQNAVKIRAQYLAAFRDGQFSPKLLDILSSGTFWPRIFLENPDVETVSRSIGRPIREWIYSVLDNAVGLPETLDEEIEHESNKAAFEGDEEDLDEIIDVVESESETELVGDDLLAPLKGELYRLHGSDNEDPSIAEAAPHSPPRPPVVSEYLRRGTRVAQEEVEVKPINELFVSVSLPPYSGFIPVVSFSLEKRMTVFLRALESDVAPVRSLPKEHIIPVLAVRWVVRTLNTRAEETKSKEREKERWTKREAACLLAMFNTPSQSCSGLAPQDSPTTVIDRNVQLTAQIVQSFESIEHLSQALLLTNTLPSSAHRFSGKVFHNSLMASQAFNPEMVSSDLLGASTFGLEHAFNEDRLTQKSKRAKKGTKNKLQADVPRGSGLFELLTTVAA
ncbi:hypothetical protein C0992_005635 [Termitomyces sp. T32_za158]|nr:hypothetical protein C0992_005635 [Termitomyces sp. T32_za158]